jgi:ferredoxin-NADP reductase
MSWRVATVVALRDQSPTARSILLTLPGWPGHAAGQHVDVRLTAPDGYSAVRSYSIASAADGDRIELTVEQLPDGEVSPYLVNELIIGDAIEVRGPIGGWFVWRPDQREPIQLIAGGSGVVPLVAIARAHAAARNGSPIRLLYSVRDPASVLYGGEFEDLARSAPPGWDRPPGRVDAALVADSTWPPDLSPTCYVCGPTGFVEAVADLLVEAGHGPARIRTERFGPTGGLR